MLHKFSLLLRTLLLISTLAISALAHAQLVPTPLGGGLTCAQMVNVLLADSPGITINSVTCTGANAAILIPPALPG